MADPTPTTPPPPAPDPNENESKKSGCAKQFGIGLLVLALQIALSLATCSGATKAINKKLKAQTSSDTVAMNTEASAAPEPMSDNHIWLTADAPIWSPGQVLPTIEFTQVEIPGAKNPNGNTIWVHGLMASYLECWTGTDGNKAILKDATVTESRSCQDSNGAPIPDAYVMQSWLDSSGKRVDLIVVRETLVSAGMPTEPGPVPGYTDITVACVPTNNHPCELASQ